MKIQLLHGDVMEVLPTLAANSVHCVVTSPPYFALRSYLAKGDPLKSKEIGSEPTPEAFIATMVAVFREVRRVLRDDGTCWVNLGDSYHNLRTWKGGGQIGQAVHDRVQHDQVQNFSGARATRHIGIKEAELLNIPHRVAEALRQDGWIWRQTVVWAKRSPMPESVAGWRWTKCRVKVGQCNKTGQAYSDAEEVPGNPRTTHNGTTFHGAQWTDCPGCLKCAEHGGYVLRRGSGRCTTAHEYLFLFAKTNRYFWDAAASQEAATSTSGEACVGKAGAGNDRKVSAEENAAIRAGSRNMRSVWTLSSEPTKEKHFATFPSELVRRCLSGSVSAKGVCPTCGAPWAPVVEIERTFESGSGKAGNLPAGKNGHAMQGGGETGDIRRGPVASVRATTYRPTCLCPPHEPTGATILDPFSGLATVGQTARYLGHSYIGIDLNQAYIDIAERRILELPRWVLRKLGDKPKKKRHHRSQGRLFA